MADAHSTPDTTVFKITQAERFTRVGYRPIKGNHDTPAINIAGQWLKDAGFTTGQPLKLRIMPGCIVITTQDIHELWGNLQALTPDLPPGNRLSCASCPAALSSPRRISMNSGATCKR
nr:type I toxin-antitoxin system SymE family toxin [Pectobacterium odoriferum]